MPSRHTYNYSSSSGSSRSSSSSADALAKEFGGLSINQKQASSYDPRSSSRLDAKYLDPRRTPQRPSSKYEPALITPDTSKSRTKYNYGEPVIRDERKTLNDERRSKTSDSRYHTNSFLDTKPVYSTSSKKEKREDSRFYPNSSYYVERR